MIEWGKNIIENPVLLSIITGLITFVITWPINNWLTKRTSKKEYLARIDKCNEEIIHACEDYVIMVKENRDDVFENIIKGICVENKINLEETYSVQSVKSILVKNFVDMRLISDSDKKNIIDKLCQKNNTDVQNGENEVVIEKIVHVDNGREKEIKKTTVKMTALISGIAGMITSLISVDNEIQRIDLTEKDMVLILAMMIVFVQLALIFYKKNKKWKNKE